MRQLAATTLLSSIRSRKPSFVGARRPTNPRAENRRNLAFSSRSAPFGLTQSMIYAGGRVKDSSGWPGTPRRASYQRCFWRTAPKMGCGNPEDLTTRNAVVALIYSKKTYGTCFRSKAKRVSRHWTG